MRHPARALFASLAIAAFLAGASAWPDGPQAAPQDTPDRQSPEAKHDEPPPKTPAEERADLYTRLAASKDADETGGIITRLLGVYSESGSDTADQYSIASNPRLSGASLLPSIGWPRPEPAMSAAWLRHHPLSTACASVLGEYGFTALPTPSQCCAFYPATKRTVDPRDQETRTLRPGVRGQLSGLLRRQRRHPGGAGAGGGAVGDDRRHAAEQLAQAVGWDDPAKGARLAERALGLIEPGREQGLELAARHALIWFLNDCGMGRQALELLERTRPLYRECGESEARVLLPWLEARICRGLGQLGAAERGLAAVWHSYRKAGFPRELTLVTLDLAEVFLAQGKGRHAMRLLKCFHGILGHWGRCTPRGWRPGCCWSRRRRGRPKGRRG